ncbi:MAG: DUF72 domain-containing protein [Candidatus Thorarchaeota archaeon]
MTIYLGTTGWHYPFWRGRFYPNDTKSELKYYARHSKLNEINTTFYSIPSHSLVKRWYKSTPEDFQFTAKMIRDVTHSSNLSSKSDLIEEFFLPLRGLEPKLKGILLQFPPSFRFNSNRLQYLVGILDECSKHFSRILILELRNSSWLIPELKYLITDYSLVLTDTTKIMIPPDFFSKKVPVYYVRILGDRKAIPDSQLGRTFLVKDTEIDGLVSRIKQFYEVYQRIFILINNRFSGYAINDVISLRRRLTREKLDVQGFSDASKYLPRQYGLSEFFG